MIDGKVLKKLKNIKVLVVEDDNIALLAIKQNLSLFCKEVLIASDGLEGFEKFEQFKPDVVITDISMPKMDGLELIEYIHNVSPHLPVIIMTSYNTSENILESINQGAYTYLQKPIEIEELQIALLMATKDIYNSTINLESGFLYHRDMKELYFNNNLVKLTKTETKLFNLLCSNAGKVFEYDVIEIFVWEDKQMSAEALRMCIKKIRAKTHSKIIENVQSRGYKVSPKI